MRYAKSLVVAMLLFLSIGCAAHSKWHYERQTENLAEQKLGAKISLDAGLGEYKDTLRERTMEKFKKLPMFGDSVNGFEGILHNDGAHRVVIVLRGRSGIEIQPVSLDHGDTAYVRLMPDTYDYEIRPVDMYGQWRNHSLTGWGIVHVGARVAIYTIRGQVIHRHFFITSYY